MEPTEGLITVQEAAERKHVAVTTIYGAISRGEITASEVFGRKVIRVVDVDAFEPASYGGIVRAHKRRGPTRKPEGTAD